MIRLLLSLIFLTAISHAYAGGKLLATPGVAQVEGAAGGGLVPWAGIAGYGTGEEISTAGFCTRVDVDDFRLDSCGVQLSFFNRVELSFAQQHFDVRPLETTLKQDISGIKIRLLGDLVYSPYPQVSLGAQHKRLKTPAIASALGAQNTTGTDVYLAASKLHLGAAAGYSLLWNLTARYTDANEMGLLGFGSANHSANVQLEASAAVLLNPSWAIGVEYRQKPDQLHLKEDDWYDGFVAWFPNKHLSVTAAYVNLGRIAAIDNQTGWYLSLVGYY